MTSQSQHFEVSHDTGVNPMQVFKYHIVAVAAALGLSSLIFAITLS
jgi:hypothetical protein